METDSSLEGATDIRNTNSKTPFHQTAIRNAVQIHVERMKCPPTEGLKQVNDIISLQYQRFSLTLYLSKTILLYTCLKNLYDSTYS